jgi:copper homeostasis protein
LCSDLLEGGVTPSIGLIEAVRSRISIGLHPIIRPRAGDFCYTEEEFDVMRRDLEIAKTSGVDGVVLGILDPTGKVDLPRTRRLIELAHPLPVTFHRAFDMSADLVQSLEDVCAVGAQRLLTSGGEQTCSDGVGMIAQLVNLARNRIKIMAGGGIGLDNAAHIIQNTGVTEIHVGLGSPVTGPMLYRNPRVSLGKTHGREYDRTQVLEANVRKLTCAIEAAAGRRKQLNPDCRTLS